MKYVLNEGANTSPLNKTRGCKWENDLNAVTKRAAPPIGSLSADSTLYTSLKWRIVRDFSPVKWAAVGDISPVFFEDSKYIRLVEQTRVPLRMRWMLSLKTNIDKRRQCKKAFSLFIVTEKFNRTGFLLVFLELFNFLLKVVALNSHPTSIKFCVESVKYRQILSSGRDGNFRVYAVE